MVLGVDQRGDPFLYAPQDTLGQAKPMNAQTEAITLPDTIRLDHTPGRERILALFCPESFAFEDLKPELAGVTGSTEGPLGKLRDSCAQRELQLWKPAVEEEP